MFELILAPFKLCWTIITTVFEVAFALIGMIFSLIGGVIQFILTITVIVLIVGLIYAVYHSRQAQKTQDIPFNSYYDQDGKVE